MLIFLLAFALIPLAVRSIGIRIGVQVFPLIALLPLAAFIHALTRSAEVAAGHDVVETVSWIPQLGIDLTLRLDPLSWLMTLIVTGVGADRKSTRLNSSHVKSTYAVFCLKKKKRQTRPHSSKLQSLQ